MSKRRLMKNLWSDKLAETFLHVWGSGGLNHQATAPSQERFAATRERVAERRLRLSKMHVYNTNYKERTQKSSN